MKVQSFTKSLTLLTLYCALVFTVALLGGCKGSDGAAGANGHNAAFGSSVCTDCHHMSNLTTNSIEPFRLTSSNSIATGGTTTSGTSITLSVKSVFSNGTYTVHAAGYYWEFMDGLPSTASGPFTGPTLTVALTTVPAGGFRAALVNNEKLPDRTMVVPVNGFSQELAQNSEYTVTVIGDDGKIYYDLAKIKAADTDVATYAPILSAGIANVPINLPVLLNARGTGPYNWSLVTNPSLTAALDATNIKNPYFKPDVAGQYVLNVITTPTGTTVPVTDSLTIYAGDWRGAITDVDMTALTADGNGTPVPDAVCTGCHNNSTAPDKFTPWKATGHATRFEEGLNGTGYKPASCGSCHTVGFVSTGAKGNNGFRDQPNYSAFIADTAYVNQTTANSSLYKNMASSATYSALFKETGIQCENCHGPQNTDTGRTPSSFSTAHDTTSNGAGPRTSLAADVCGLCHGSPQHHGRFQELQESLTGHANFDLAIGEGTNASCAGCHSGQGNLIWIKQLAAGNPLRGLPSASITWTADNVQPQTCSVCHDPHNVGTITGLSTDAQPRITGDTPKLPAGFAALGVGKGAQCMICHNSRNGGVGSTNPDGTVKVDSTLGVGGSYLHEDNDPIFASIVSTKTGSYAAPHSAAQGDVLMGHNAYFMGDSGGNASNYKSPHATITDTCVNCHMVQTKPPQEFSDYENTNHTFKASLEICTNCHGVDSGLGPKLQMDTQAMLDKLMSDIGKAVISQATGTFTGNITAVNIYLSHGAPVADLTYASSTDIAVPLEQVVPLNTIDHRNLAKAIWNYFLFANDNSLGVHNPNFTRDALGITDAKVIELF